MTAPNTETPSQLEYIGGNSPDGVCIGPETTDKVAFFAATPVAQQTGAAAVTTASATTTTQAYGFATAAQADGIVSLVNALRTALVNLGLITDV
jgi:hypothetical protein